MHRSAYAAALALSALLLIVAPAHAYKQRALQAAAYSFWGGAARTTCPHGITTARHAPADDDAADLPENTVGWARIGICTVHLSVYRPFAGAWPADCATYLHEVGHILDHDHDFTGYGHIMDADTALSRSVGYPVGHPERRRVYWSGVGTYWCLRYQREHPRAFATRRR